MDNIKMLLLATEESGVQQLTDIFAGFDVFEIKEVIAYSDGHGGFDKKDTQMIYKFIKENDIDIVISNNFSCSAAALCLDMDIIYLIFLYDTDQKELDAFYAKYPCNFFGIFDESKQKDLMKREIENVLYLDRNLIENGFDSERKIQLINTLIINNIFESYSKKEKTYKEIWYEYSNYKFFYNLEKKRQVYFNEYSEKVEWITECLRKGDTDKLLELTEYFKTDSGRYMQNTSAKFKKVSNIISIIGLEKGESVFCFNHGVDNYNELLYKYNKLTLYMRRLGIGLEEEYQREFFEFVDKENISVIALHIVSQTELIAEDIKIGCTYYDKVADKELGLRFLILLLYNHPNNADILIRIADYYLNIGEFSVAYSHLSRIEHPTDTVAEILNELRGVISNG